MANWPSSATRSGNFYYKVATNADHILVGNTEDDIDYNYKGSKNHAHYIKENGEWGVRTTTGGTYEEIVAEYGKRDYGKSLYGTTRASVGEGVSSWLDGLLAQWR